MRQVSLTTVGFNDARKWGVNRTPLKGTKTASRQRLRGTQQFLDAGQKTIGAIRCKVCQMLHTPGTEDDAVHARHCRPAPRPLPFAVDSKHHRIVAEDAMGVVVMIDSDSRPGDRHRVSTLKAEFDRRPVPKGWTFDKAFVLVEQRRVVGLAIAEQIDAALPMDADITQLSPTVPAVCGIHSLRVTPGCPDPHCVYKRLVDAARLHLVFGYVVPDEKVAFNAPSDEVREWVRAFQERPLVYHRA